MSRFLFRADKRRERYWFLPLSTAIALLVAAPGVLGEEADNGPLDPKQSPFTVGHNDTIEVDNALTLTQLLDLTLENYPDSYWLSALEEEAKAIDQRSKSWIAGAPQVNFGFQEATSGTLHYGDASVQVPLWNLGQRAAEQKLAEQAGQSAGQQTSALRLRLAGLIRAALWDMALQKIRYEQALAEVKVFKQLLKNISRRVELGDLPRADELLAESELLQKRSTATLAEAELMHARKRYQTITQTSKIPAHFQEQRASLTEIQQNHPALLAMKAQIERKYAELNTLKAQGPGQTHLALGVNSDRGDHDPRSNQTESFNIMVNMPFGGSIHLAPKIAAVNVELNRLLAERELLRRNLEQLHHEAEHNLEVNRVEMEIANHLKTVAEQHLAMMESAFAVGEIDLMDLLKVQSRAQQAILNAKERAVMLERDQALYNQAVGVMP